MTFSQFIQRVEADCERDLAEADSRRDRDRQAALDKRQEAVDHAEWFRKNYPDVELTSPTSTAHASPAPSGKASTLPPKSDHDATGRKATGRSSAIQAMKEFILTADIFSAEGAVEAIYAATKRRPLLASIRSHMSRLATKSCGELEVVERGTKKRAQTFRKTAKFDVNSGVPRTNKPTKKNANPLQEKLDLSAA